MLLEHQSVSRKTPGDGKLEISPAAAARLADLGAEFPLVAAGREGSARLDTLECTCGKRGEGSHVHHFLESPMLRDLTPGTQVRVALDQARASVRIEPVSAT